MLEKLQGYRTIISIVVSMLLKVLALKGVISSEQNTASNVSLATDALLLTLSGVADLAGIWFKLKSTAPGPLSEQGKAHAAWLKDGVDRRATQDVAQPVPQPDAQVQTEPGGEK